MNRDDIILTQQALVISVWFNNLSEYLNERQCNSEKKNWQRYGKEAGGLP